MPRRNGTGIELLADPTRRRIVTLLAVRPSRPSTIASRLGLSRPAVSRQLGLLYDAGLIRGIPFIPDGRGAVYMIDPQAHGRITAWLAGTEVGMGFFTEDGAPLSAAEGAADPDEAPPTE